MKPSQWGQFSPSFLLAASRLAPTHQIRLTSTTKRKAVLRRPLEPGLAALVGVVDQPGRRPAARDGHLQGVDDQLGSM
jgi:hypothetical protein